MPITESDSRYEPVVLVAAAAVLGVALAFLGARRLLWAVAAAAVATAMLVTPAAPWAGRLPGVDLAACLAVAALGAVVLGGWGGRPFLAPLAISGLCAYTVVWVVDGLGQPEAVAVCCAMGVALALGLLLAAVADRRGRDAVAVVSLVLAAVLDTTVFHSGGLRRLPGYDPGGAQVRHWAVCALLAASLLAVAALRRSRLRLALVAARGDARAAAVRGVDVAGARCAAWVTAALLAGAAGCALVLEQGGAAPGLYDPTTSVTLVVLVSLLGGGRITSALLAGAVCGAAADPSGAAPGIAGGEPAWLCLAVGTTAVLGLVVHERRRCGHKRPMRWIGPAVAAALGHVSPSQRRTAGFGAMSGDAE